MSFLALNILSESDRDSALVATDDFIKARHGEKVVFLVYEPFENGSFIRHLAELIDDKFEVYSVSCVMEHIDVEILSYAIEGAILRDRYILTDNGGCYLIRGSKSTFLLTRILEASKAGRDSPDSLFSLIKTLLSVLEDANESIFLIELRVTLIALENFFKFEFFRTSIGGCLEADPGLGVSRSITEALKFSKALELSKSAAYKEISEAVQGLRDGADLFLKLSVPPSRAEDLAIYRKTQVWSASMHLSLAASLSTREEHATGAIHHAVRCLECYLSGLGVAAGKLTVNRYGVLYGEDNKKILGIGGLLALSPVSVPSEIESIIQLRNKSELAHGNKRWGRVVASDSAEKVKDFIHSMDSSHSGGEFFFHYRKASSLHYCKFLRESVESYFTQVTQRIELISF